LFADLGDGPTVAVLNPISGGEWESAVVTAVMIISNAGQFRSGLKSVRARRPPSYGTCLDCGGHVAAVTKKCHGGKDRTPQIERGEVKCEQSAAAVAHSDVQIVLVERMQLIGPEVKPHIVWLETLVKLNPYLVSAH
jgi:hypothetical protein